MQDNDGSDEGKRAPAAREPSTSLVDIGWEDGDAVTSVVADAELLDAATTQIPAVSQEQATRLLGSTTPEPPSTVAAPPAPPVISAGAVRASQPVASVMAPTVAAPPTDPQSGPPVSTRTPSTPDSQRIPRPTTRHESTMVSPAHPGLQRPISSTLRSMEAVPEQPSGQAPRIVPPPPPARPSPTVAVIPAPAPRPSPTSPSSVTSPLPVPPPAGRPSPSTAGVTPTTTTQVISTVRQPPPPPPAAAIAAASPKGAPQRLRTLPIGEVVKLGALPGVIAGTATSSTTAAATSVSATPLPPATTPADAPVASAPAGLTTATPPPPPAAATAARRASQPPPPPPQALRRPASIPPPLPPGQAAGPNIRRPSPPPSAAGAAIRTLKITAGAETTPRLGTTQPSEQVGAVVLPSAAAVVDELRSRAERTRGDDPLTASRVWIEVAIHELYTLRRPTDARGSLRRALTITPGLAAALGRTRRLLRPQQDSADLIALIDEELKNEGDVGARVSLLTERARLASLAGHAADARSALETARTLAPDHPVVLRSLEVLLRRALTTRWNDDDARRLAAVLERMADAVEPSRAAADDADPRLAARLFVEQGQLLDRIAGDQSLARAAFDRAVALEPAAGPSRNALNEHLLRRGDDTALASSLAAEADLETDDVRAVRLLFFAARILVEVAKRPDDATALLERASKRLPAQGSSTPIGEIGARVLSELGRLLEVRGSERDAAEVYERWIATISDPEALAHEHTRIVELFESIGRFDRAADHARNVVALRPTDISARNRLDRILRRLGGNRERVSVWSSLAGTDIPLSQQVAGLRRAARILEAELGRRDEAISHLRSAWVLDPGNGDVFDDLSALLAPRHEPADIEPAKARIELLEGAARVAREPDRRLAILEKLVALWEDELGRPDRALEVIDQILAIEPDRRSAILALQRNAKRAGNYAALSRGLQSEARQTRDTALRRRLLLRAAEVTEAHLSDVDRARQLLDEAVAVEPVEPAALIARFAHHQRAKRFDAARLDLQKLAKLEPDAAQRAGLWIDVAILDEHGRKNPRDAVAAYLAAAEAYPALLLPRREIARILRSVEDPQALVDALVKLAELTTHGPARRSLLLEAAELQELALRDPSAALATLARATTATDGALDPALGEATERLYRRAGSRTDLASLIERRLDADPPPATRHRLELTLAEALSATAPDRAAQLFQGLSTTEPHAVASSRALTQLRRSTRSPALVLALELELAGARSRFARAGTLYDLADESVRANDGAEDPSLLERIIADIGLDGSVLDRLMRSLVDATDAAEADPTRAGRLLTALRARKGTLSTPIDRALTELEEALLAEGFSSLDATWLDAAHNAFTAAVSLWPETLLGARGLERTSMRKNDRLSLRESQIALSRVVDGARARARHLITAAELSADAEAGEMDDTQNLYLEALRVDPDALAAARSLVPLLNSMPGALIASFGQALERATDPTQIMLLGSELARSVLRSARTEHPSDPTLGVAAMRRVVEIAPNDAGHQMLLGHALVHAQVWNEARTIFDRLAQSEAQELRVEALFELASLHATALNDPARAREALLAILGLVPDDPRALEGLLRVATVEGRRDLVSFALQRLAETTTDPARRVEMALRLAEVRRSEGDLAGAELALREAIVASPQDQRAWNGLRALYRTDGPDGAAAFASALNNLLTLANTRGVRVEPRWLTTLGLLEASVLRRPSEALLHLEQAVRLPTATPDTRVALGRGLEVIGRSGEAIQLLREVVTRDADTFATLSDLVPALESLDAALAREGRNDENLAVEEARACVGFVPPERVAALRARPVIAGAMPQGSLAREFLDDLRVPEARDPLLEVGVVIQPVLAKVLRFELANVSISSRDRISPRDGHPARILADKLARALGVESFELYLSASWQGPLRAFPGDPPAIVGPTSLTSLPELEQAFAIAHELARIAIGTVGLDDLPPSDVDAVILGALRAVDPEFPRVDGSMASEDSSEAFAAAFQRHLARKQRRRIEEILPTLSPRFDSSLLLSGAHHTEIKAAYVLTGSLISSLDYLRRIDRSLAAATDAAALIRHPLASTVFRFSITADAFGHRRRVGTTWA